MIFNTFFSIYFLREVYWCLRVFVCVWAYVGRVKHTAAINKHSNSIKYPWNPFYFQMHAHPHNPNGIIKYYLSWYRWQFFDGILWSDVVQVIALCKNKRKQLLVYATYGYACTVESNGILFVTERVSHYTAKLWSALYTCQLVQFPFKHKHLNKRLLISNGSYSQNITQRIPTTPRTAHRTNVTDINGWLENTVILFFE